MVYYIVDNEYAVYRDGFLSTDTEETSLSDYSIIVKTFNADSYEDASKVLSAYNTYADMPMTYLNCCPRGCCVKSLRLLS